MVALLVEVHREGFAPVALPGEQPVPEAEVDLAQSESLLLEPVDHGGLRFDRGVIVDRKTFVRRVDADPFAAVAGVFSARRVADDLHDGSRMLREGVIAFVVSRDGHDRTVSVFHQDVVGDPDRDAFAGGRIDGPGARCHPRLLARVGAPVEIAAVSCPFHVGGDLRIPLGSIRRAENPVHQRVFGSQHHERDSEDRVRSRRVHLETARPGGFDLEVLRRPRCGRSIPTAAAWSIPASRRDRDPPATGRRRR